MIRIGAAAATLSPAERYGLDLLVDLARLVPVEDAAADVVELEVTGPAGAGPALPPLIAGRWMIEPGDGVVRLPRTTLRAVTDIAAAVAEQRSGARDRLGRVPPAANALVAAGLEREAVVSRAALRLREAVVAAAGRRAVRLVAPWPGGRRWAAAITHDLDVVAWWPLFTALRLAELVRKGEARAALRAAWAAAGAIGRDPVGRAALAVLEHERSCGIRSTWFILCGTPTVSTVRAGDLTYMPESAPARRIIAAVAERGHAIGLHGSFATADRPGEFGAQRARLERIAGRTISGVRQHFLRIVPGRTHRDMERAGFGYDATSGFPDRNGFRLGVADILPVWDDEAGRPLAIEEAPLCWMDRALSKYRRIEDPRAWIADALALTDECKAVNGLWVGLWHPNLVAALGYPGAPEAYGELVRGVLAAEPHVGTLDELVAWRRNRRGARIRSLAPDGRAEVVAPAQTAPNLESPAR